MNHTSIYQVLVRNTLFWSTFPDFLFCSVWCCCPPRQRPGSFISSTAGNATNGPCPPVGPCPPLPPCKWNPAFSCRWTRLATAVSPLPRQGTKRSCPLSAHPPFPLFSRLNVMMLFLRSEETDEPRLFHRFIPSMGGGGTTIIVVYVVTLINRLLIKSSRWSRFFSGRNGSRYTPYLKRIVHLKTRK